MKTVMESEQAKLNRGSDSVQLLVRILQEEKCGLTAAQIGNIMWAKRTQGDIVPARFARPAGKLLAAAKRLHLVYEWTVARQRLFYANVVITESSPKKD